jgi:RNA-directed DNA polymerase
VFCETEEDAIQCVEVIKGWLAQRGLNISPEKTSIKHLTVGFDFLGFNIRHYRDSNTATGWKLLIKPSRASVQKVRAKLRDIWLSPARFRLSELLEKLNSVIRGWGNYFRTGVSKEIFSGLDQWMFIRERRHTLENAPQKRLEVETKTLLR